MIITIPGGELSHKEGEGGGFCGLTEKFQKVGHNPLRKTQSALYFNKVESGRGETRCSLEGGGPLEKNFCRG